MEEFKKVFGIGLLIDEYQERIDSIKLQDPDNDEEINVILVNEFERLIIKLKEIQRKVAEAVI